MRATFRNITAVVTLLVLSALTCFAQTSRGTVTGTVTDPSGAVIPNATVVLASKSTKLEREAKTNAVGLYRFDAVDLGEYDLKVSMTGFSSASITGVTVTAARTIDIPVELKIGNAEVVEVTGNAEALQTTEQVRIRSIDARALADLPIQQQNSLNLLLTAPGVATTDAGGSINSGIGSVNGTRPRGNNFLIDGVSNNDISVAGPAITPTNNDAIQEVTIQTSNFSAEFGRAGGAVVNQVTKSGTNSLHGTVAWVYRSQLFNASDRDERLGNPTAKDPRAKFKENIPAFTIGGPVYIPGLYDGRGKTFFFAGGQWDRYSDAGAAVTFTVPTAAGIATLQSLAAACPNVALYLNSIDGLVAPAQNASSLAQNGVSIAIPANVFAVTGSCNGNARTGMRIPYGNATRAAASVQLNDNHVARIDHRINDRHSLSGRWLYTNSFANNATIAVSRFFDADQSDRSMSALITHNYVHSPTLTNELRLNYGRINPQFPLSNPALAGTLPAYTIGTVSGFGAAATFPQGRTANNYQLQNTMTMVRGKHQIRFGADLLRQIATQRAPANVRGNITYTSSQVVAGQANTGVVEAFANFIDNFSGPTGTMNIVYGTPKYHPTNFQQAYFIQDSWRVTPTFTLNLGLRYENFGQTANIFKYPVVTLDAASYGVPSKVNNDNNNFGPSVGFAWNPRPDSGWLNSLLGEGKTVIRGGFQMSYDAWFNNLYSNMAGSVPNLVGAVAPAPAANNATPRGIANWSGQFSALTPAPLNPLTDTGSQFMKDMPNPYTLRYSLGVQREVRWGIVADVSYVGTQSRKQLINVQLNPRQPNATFTAVQPINNAANNTGRLIPTIGGRTPRVPAGNANFNSLQVDVRKAFSETVIGGLQFASAYTWSKSMDNVASAEFTTNQAVTSFSQFQNVFLQNRNIDYGRSDNDRTHTWQTSLVWDVRGPKQGWKYNAFGGFTLAFLIPLTSGEPFNLFQGRDRDFDGGTNDRPDVGNWNAPINTRARIVSTATCSSGYQNPDVGTAVGVGCVTPNDVRWIQVAGYSLPGDRTIGRNALTTPGSVLVNMTAIKKFRITEGTQLEYRAEITNLANHENFNYAPWNNVNINSTAKFLDYSDGRPTGARFTNSRKINMGLKFIF